MREAPWAHELAWPSHLKPFDPFDTDIQASPYAHYAWMRDHAPVVRAGLPDAPLTIVTRFADVTDGLRNAVDFQSSPRTGVHVPGFLLHLDPPQHTKLRQTISRAFTPRAMAALEPAVAALVRARWQAVLEQGGGEMMELFASPLTISVISAVLGVPAEHAPMMREWTTKIIDYFGALFRGVPNEDIDDTSFKRLSDYMDGVMEKATGNDEENVIGNLAQLRAEGVLTREEAAGFAALLFMAGHETTTLLTGNCLDFLSANPEWLDHLRTEDGPTSFLNEMIRFRPPVHRLTRYVHDGATIGGYDIPAGSSVRFVVASANRDAAKFPDPDRFDPTRKNAAQAGFGYGIHMCMGSWLAKMELRLILTTIAQSKASIAPDPAIQRIPMAGGAFATVGLHSLGLRVIPSS